MERISIQELAILFEIPIEEVPNISPMDESQLKIQVDKFKSVFKKQYRILVKKYHPDVAEDKELAHEKLIKLNKYMKAINTMVIQSVQIQQPMTMQYSFSFRYYNYSGSTTSGYYSGTNTS